MSAFITDYLRVLHLFSRDVRLFLLSIALFGLSYFGFVTVLLNLYLLRLGYGTGYIGLVNASTAIAFALSSIPAGAAGSRWGYRRTIVLGVGLASTATIFLPLAEFLPGSWRDAGIVISRLFAGLGFAFYFVNANPYLIAATELEERNYVFSMQFALLPLAGFAGSLIAGAMPDFFATILNVSLDHPAPFRYPLILAGVLLLPGALALLTTQEITIKSGTVITDQAVAPKNEAVPYVLITFLALTALLRMTGEGAARSFFNVYLDAGLGESTSRIGLLTAVGQLLAGPAALIAPLFILRLGKVPAIVHFTLWTAGSLLLMGLIPHWAMVGFGFMGVVGMLAITQSVAAVVQMEIVPSGWRGTTSGITSMATGLGFSAMALGGGYLIPTVDYWGLYFIAAGLVAISALLFWLYFRTPRGEYARSDYTSPEPTTARP